MRTVERDINALQQSGVPIYAEPGRTGGYCVDKARTLQPVNLTPGEAVAMAVALRRLEGTPFQATAGSALHKLVAPTPSPLPTPTRRPPSADERNLGQVTCGMATHWTLGCDAADPHRLASFWAFALGYVDEPGYDDPDGASIIDPDGKGPAIGFLRVPEPKTAKNRMHIDIRVAGEAPWDMAERERLIRAKVAELVAAGATAVREESYGGPLGHVEMRDPEGNEFCVA